VSKRDPKRIVSFDSMVLIWGIRRKGPDEMIGYARNLFRELEEAEAQIVIPSIVVAEFVTPLRSQAERSRVIAALCERFLIVPFDARDAALAAELWNHGRKDREMRKPSARVCLRADSMIVASAYGHGATEFYSEDDSCRRIAKKIMTAKKLPRVAPSLFPDDGPDVRPA